MPRKSSTPEAIQAKRAAIFQATRKLLASQDFHALKMDDIAKRAGIAKGSLYLYFKDKESLYAALVQSLFDKLSPQVKTLLKSNTPPKQLLRRVLEIQVAFFEEHMDVFVHFFREGPGPRAHKDSLKISFRQYVGHLTGIVRRGIAQGQFRHVSPVKAALVMVGMVRSAIVERIHGFTRAPLSRDLDEIWKIYMDGIGK